MSASVRPRRRMWKMPWRSVSRPPVLAREEDTRVNARGSRRTDGGIDRLAERAGLWSRPTAPWTRSKADAGKLDIPTKGQTRMKLSHSKLSDDAFDYVIV